MSIQLNVRKEPTQLVTITTKTPPTQIKNRLQTGTTNQLTIDAGALEKELHAAVRGEVRFGGADRGMYASDASNYRMIPLGVILPRDAQDVVAAVAGCSPEKPLITSTSSRSSLTTARACVSGQQVIANSTVLFRAAAGAVRF